MISHSFVLSPEFESKKKRKYERCMLSDLYVHCMHVAVHTSSYAQAHCHVSKETVERKQTSTTDKHCSGGSVKMLCHVIFNTLMYFELRYASRAESSIYCCRCHCVS
jgi:hypothetical protein